MDLTEEKGKRIIELKNEISALEDKIEAIKREINSIKENNPKQIKIQFNYD